MCRRWKIAVAVLLLGGFLGPVCAESGRVGASCWAEPIIASESRTNWCRTVPRKLYPGVLMPVAKEATVRECKRLNALDYGHYGNPPGNCSDECERKTFCVYGASD